MSAEVSPGSRYGGGGGFISKPCDRGDETQQWRLRASGRFVLGVSAVLSAAGVFVCGELIRVEK